MKKKYVIVMEQDPKDGCYGIVAPDAPGFSSAGDSYEHALAMAVEGLELYLEVLADDGEPIPPTRSLEEIKKTWEDWDEWEQDPNYKLVTAEVTVNMPRNMPRNVDAPRQKRKRAARTLATAAAL